MPPLLMLIITFPLQRDSGARAARNFRFFSSLAFLLRSGYKPLTVLGPPDAKPKPAVNLNNVQPSLERNPAVV